METTDGSVALFNALNQQPLASSHIVSMRSRIVREIMECSLGGVGISHQRELAFAALLRYGQGDRQNIMTHELGLTPQEIAAVEAVIPIIERMSENIIGGKLYQAALYNTIGNWGGVTPERTI